MQMTTGLAVITRESHWTQNNADFLPSSTQFLLDLAFKSLPHEKKKKKSQNSVNLEELPSEMHTEINR